MTPTERLELLLGGDAAPVLAPTVIASLLEDAARPDPDGLLPGDLGWIPTYDFNMAAALGYRYKAAMVAGGYDFAVEGKSFNRSQAFDHFEQMSKKFSLLQATTGGLGSIRLGTDSYGRPAEVGDYIWATDGYWEYKGLQIP